jgi:Flp pilus assembly protein CpaB
MKAVLVSIVSGGLVGVLAVTLFAVPALSEKKDVVRAGWTPRQVLVVTRDVSQGESLSADMFKQSDLPEQFTSDSFVPADDQAIVVGTKVSLPLMAGDVLSWSAFIDQARRAAVTECIGHIRQGVTEAGARAEADALARFQQQLKKLPSPPALHSPTSTEGHVLIVVAGADIREGALLSEEQLAGRRVPKELVTRSHVRATDLAALVGARLLVPLQAGDPLMWQVLDDPDAPQSSLGCVNEIKKAREEARARSSSEAATAFLGATGTP